MARGHGEAALSINVLVEELIDPASREWVPYVRCLVVKLPEPRQTGSAAAKCGNQIDLRLTFIEIPDTSAPTG